MSAALHRSALDALWDCRRAWQRQDQQTSIDLWGDSPEHVEGHSRTTGGLASRAGNGNKSPAALDYPDALNARPGPETARADRPAPILSPPGSSVEGATDDGRKGNCGPAVPSLTTKQGGASAPPTRRKRGVGRK